MFCGKRSYFIAAVHFLCSQLCAIAGVEASDVEIDADTTISGSACSDNAANNVTITAGTTVTVDCDILSFPMGWQVNSLTVDGTINHPDADTDGVVITTLGNINVSGTGVINVNSRGYDGSSGSATGGGPGGGDSSRGGGYGGNGGYDGGLANDSLTIPDDLGSGGGGSSGCCGSSRGGDGGGKVVLQVAGTLTVDGSITANGGQYTGSSPYWAGGGSGGAVRINAGTLEGGGSITADGGNAYLAGGSGGGGRIAILYENSSFAGTFSASSGQTADAGKLGGAGTIYLKDTDTLTFDLIIANGANAANEDTPLTAASDFGGESAGTLTVANSRPNITGSLTVESDVLLTGSIMTVSETFTVNDDLTVTDTALNVIGLLWPLNSIAFTGTSSLNTPSLTSTQDVVIPSGTTVSQVDGDTAGLTITAPNLEIEESGSINVNSRGYYGSYGATTAGGPGGGSSASGGGYGGNGGYSGGIANGSLTMPDDLGSAGAGSSGCCGTSTGGDGGGKVILNITDTLTVNGSITANGGRNTSSGAYWAGGGAGGTVRIDAGTLEGSGSITADGGSAYLAGGSGGGGRIAIYYGSSTFAGTFSASGGQTADAGKFGGAGTIYLKDNATSVFDLIIANGTNAANENTPLITGTDFGGQDIMNLMIANARPVFTGSVPVSGTANFSGSSTTITGALTSDLLLLASTTLTVQSIDTVQDIVIPSGSTVSQVDGDTAGLTITVPNLTVEESGSISVNSRGYYGGYGSATGGGPGGGSSSRGGGYGGNGGYDGGLANGSLTMPDDLGSGGSGGSGSGSPSSGGDGGGKVVLQVAGILTVDGSITANGGQYTGSGFYWAGGGSGGTVRIDAGMLEGDGLIAADGGGAYSAGGSGGGGRIAIYYDSSTFGGNLSASGGQTADAGKFGGAGTIYLYNDTSSTFDLIIANGANAASEDTPLAPATDIDDVNVENLTVTNSRPNITGSLTVENDVLLTGSVMTVSETFTVNDDLTVTDTALSVIGLLWPLNSITFTGTSSLNTPSLTTTQDVVIPSGTTVSQVDGDTAGLTITAPNLTIEESGSINVNSRGYYGSYGASTAGGPGGGSGARGGGYGGDGGYDGGLANGSLSMPDDLGSAGAGSSGCCGTSRGGDGGGKVILNITDTLTLDGSIRADGGRNTSSGSYWAGGGAGGTVRIDTDTFEGSGSITADGGSAYSGGGSGGGGRIAVYYDSSTFGGTFSASSGQTANAGKFGGAGTIYLKDNAASAFDLIIANGANAADENTPVDPAADFDGDDINDLTITRAKTSLGASFDVMNEALFTDSTVTLPTGVVNMNALTISGGTLTISGATLDVGLFTQGSGTTRLTGGSLSSSNTLDINGGEVKGSGMIDASVSNAGTFRPGNSAGSLQINGDYVQESTGTLEMELGGLTAGTGYDQLDVSGTATLDGTLTVLLINSFEPVKSDSFELILASGVSGGFSTQSLPTPTGDLAYKLNPGPPVTLTLKQQLTFAAWKESKFDGEELADDSYSGPDADPDGDGLTNLMEYVFGTEPEDGSSNAQLLCDYITDSNEVFLTVTFPWTPDIVDYVYALESSTDLEVWSPASVEDPPTMETGDGVDILTFQMQDSMDSQSALFVRLVVRSADR